MSNVNPDAKKGFADRLDGTKFALARPELWKFVKALCVGAMGALPEMLVYMLLCSLFARMAVSYLPDFFFFDLIIRNMDASQYLPAVQVYAFLISTAVGQAIGFVLARKYAFHANANIALSTFLKIIMIVITIGLGGIVGPAMVTLVAKIPYIKEYPGLVQVVSKVAAMAASTAWVYPSDRFIVHRVKKEVSPE
jgi:putative flippase GtrA